MRKFLVVLFLVSLASGLSAQEATIKVIDRNIGINYFGELGFRPGVELDYGWELLKVQKEKQKRIFERSLSMRPSIGYYHYAKYSNNYLFSLKFNYQFKFINKQSKKHLFVEPFVRLGYLRYFFSGDVFETVGNEIEKVNFRGTNSFIFGGAFDLGGYLTKRFDWLLGFDYFAERTEDKLLLNRFVAKLGTRIKLNLK